MARKVKITKEFLVETAFEMAREEGIAAVTARRLAAKAECSTQPIFRLYENMDALYTDIFAKAVAYFASYYQKFPTKATEPFVNLGMAYIAFAQTEKELFRLLFIPEKSYGKSTYEILNGDRNVVVFEIEKAKREGCENPSDLFMKMWVFIHGAACMAITGDFDLNEEETKKLLKDSYLSFK